MNQKLDGGKLKPPSSFQSLTFSYQPYYCSSSMLNPEAWSIWRKVS